MNIIYGNPVEQVKQFMETFGQKVELFPMLQDNETNQLRIELIEEELTELKEAIEDNDIIEVADALADLIYVVVGAAHTFGIPLQNVFDEVHRSNMSKLDETGNPIYREDGKVLKSKLYSPPDIESVLL